MQEFANAMHTMGLRLSTAEYDTLFREFDTDGSSNVRCQKMTFLLHQARKLFFEIYHVPSILLAKGQRGFVDCLDILMTQSP